MILNHQWLYFRSSRDTSADADAHTDTASIRTTTPSVFSHLRERFGEYWGGGGGARTRSSPQNNDDDDDDAMSEYSVNTTTTTRDRMTRNQSALELDTMIKKFQEAAASGGHGGKVGGFTAAIPNPAQLAWRIKADSAMSVLMHWVHQASTGLMPFLKYHQCFPQHAGQGGTGNVLPVPGYVNLVKAAWILQTLDIEKGFLGQQFGDEAKTLMGFLTCVCLLHLVHLLTDRVCR